MKKLLTTLSAFVLCAVVAFSVVACGQNQAATKTLTVDMNPNVVFMLDNNNKVTSVEFATTETNEIFYDVKFEGKSLEEAMQLFVNYSFISGHINVDVNVSGTASTDELITSLNNAAKTALENAFDNIAMEANVTAVETTLSDAKADLLNKAKNLAPDYTAEQLNAMDIQELTKIINDKQKEFAGLAVSQIEDINNAFMTGAEETLTAAITFAYEALQSAQALVDEYKDNSLIPNQVKQNAQKALNEAKAALDEAVKALNAKKAELIAAAKQAYADIKEELKNSFKTDVSNAKTSAINYFDQAVQDEQITAEQAQKLKDLIEAYSPAV